jgi:GntR family transcriptional repressor for pyruvate dehydrogenase complex
MVRPPSQVDQLEDALLGLVSERALRTGDRLPPERDLVGALGASRPALREAISRLAAGGLVVSRQGSGTYIADVDVAAITEVRLLLEPEAAARAATERTDEHAAALQRTAGAMRDSIDDRRRFAELDSTIHALIAEACGNPVLEDVLRRLGRAAALSRAATSEDAGVRGATLRDVGALVRAVTERRPEDARRAMRRHLQRLPLV